MTTRPWRQLTADAAARLYEGEIGRWASRLHWDTRAQWDVVESARRGGTLPGLVVEDSAGGTIGWSFYLRHADALQVGAFRAASPAVAACLLDGILECDEAAVASSVVFFVYADAAALAPHLERRGFAVERYRYLARSLDDWPQAMAAGRAWEDEDRAPASRLLERAYAGMRSVRPFARAGDPDEWVEYVGHIIRGVGCGTFCPAVSVVLDSAVGADSDAIVLATELDPVTAHLAQVAVDPDRQGTGVGRRVVSAALSSARRAGYARATLLVAETNVAGAGLYEDLGFAEIGEFVAAVRDQPRLSSSAALATGGESSLR